MASSGLGGVSPSGYGGVRRSGHHEHAPAGTLNYVGGQVLVQGQKQSPTAVGLRRHATYQSMQNPLFRRLGFLRSLHSAK